jgi:hypothetical protein
LSSTLFKLRKASLQVQERPTIPCSVDRKSNISTTATAASRSIDGGANQKILCLLNSRSMIIIHEHTIARVLLGN